MRGTTTAVRRRQPALGGPSRTAVVVCASRAPEHAEETVGALRFGEACHGICGICGMEWNGMEWNGMEWTNPTHPLRFGEACNVKCNVSCNV